MTQRDLRDRRQQALQQWFVQISSDLGETQTNSNFSLSAVSGDASFRRYFRGCFQQQDYILVDAPPLQENSHAFVAIARHFLREGVNVPKVYAADFEQGFMCLADFGDTLLWQKLNLDQLTLKSFQDLSTPATLAVATDLYQLAFDQLLKIQAVDIASFADETYAFPRFDEALLRKEMQLFREWFCQGLLGLTLTQAEHELLDESFQLLIDSALSQPQVCVHRDYHSRNLLYQDDRSVGVIDFQDAVLGPFSYDLVSLLKDCYIAWPRDQVNAWALDYLKLAQQQKIIAELDANRFLHSFDLMGVQRHLKAIGIFSRLYLRDQKSGYLADIPRTLGYISAVAENNSDLTTLSNFLETRVIPLVDEKIESHLAPESSP